MLSLVSPSPAINHYHSIQRRQHKLTSKCRTVKYIRRAERASIAGVSSTSLIPPTPCKFTARRRNAYMERLSRKRSLSSLSPSELVKSPQNRRRLNPDLSENSASLFLEHPDAHNGGDKSREYANLGVIGAGSLCTVFKVQQAESQCFYALKKSNRFLWTKLFSEFFSISSIFHSL